MGSEDLRPGSKSNPMPYKLSNSNPVKIRKQQGEETTIIITPDRVDKKIKYIMLSVCNQ